MQVKSKRVHASRINAKLNQAIPGQASQVDARQVVYKSRQIQANQITGKSKQNNTKPYSRAHHTTISTTVCKAGSPIGSFPLKKKNKKEQK